MTHEKRSNTFRQTSTLCYCVVNRLSTRATRPAAYPNTFPAAYVPQLCFGTSSSSSSSMNFIATQVLKKTSGPLCITCCTSVNATVVAICLNLICNSLFTIVVKIAFCCRRCRCLLGLCWADELTVFRAARTSSGADGVFVKFWRRLCLVFNQSINQSISQSLISKSMSSGILYTFRNIDVLAERKANYSVLTTTRRKERQAY